MASHKQEKAINPERSTANGEPALEQATWLAPFSSGTFLSLQNTIGNQALSQLLQGDVVQHRQNGNGYKPPLSTTPAAIQKKPEAGQGGGTTEPQTKTPEPAAPAKALIVDDDTQQLEPGQMKKTEFLDQLKSSVCGAAEEVLRDTMWSAMGCPYIERWFSHYAGQSAQYVERALRKYAPEASRVTSAKDYIPIATERVRRGLAQWAETGEMTGVPEEFAQGGMPGVTLQGLVSGALAGIGRAISSAASAIGGAISSAASSIGKALFKSREGGETNVGDPKAIREQLGTGGHSLDGGTRNRMEKAFGVSFGGVRVHTGAQAENLSENMNARAFTVGNDIAFGAGEYSPGTLVGDALIAHELAHTVQQGNGTSPAVASSGDHARGALEEQADMAAVSAVASAWGLQPKSQSQAGALTQLRSGLRLQRCTTQKPTARSLTEYAGMTAFELSKVPDADFDVATGSPSAGGVSAADYKRAAQFARAVFKMWKVDFDMDKFTGPLGEEPSDKQLKLLDSVLGEILNIDGGEVRKIVASPEGRGGKGLPKAKGTDTVSLKGRVRLWPKLNEKAIGEFSAKIYRLGKVAGEAPEGVEEDVPGVAKDYGITVGESAKITEQEKALVLFDSSRRYARGFYFPTEDTFYLEPGTDPLEDPRTRAVARHEIGHLLGAGLKTQAGFQKRYGENYRQYWRPFEEGMGEFVRTETQSEAEKAAIETPEIFEEETTTEKTKTGTTTTTTSGGRTEDPFYTESEAWIRKLMAVPGNRPILLNAFFTGNVSDELFTIVESITPPK